MLIGRSITVFAPASVANVGPCYDLMGYAVDYVGDFVTVEAVPKREDVLVWGGVEASRSRWPTGTTRSACRSNPFDRA